MLHRQEPAMLHQGEVQTLCEITMKYHGPNLTLPRDRYDPTQNISIDQQHCGGNTLTVFKENLKPGGMFNSFAYLLSNILNLKLDVAWRKNDNLAYSCHMVLEILMFKILKLIAKTSFTFQSQHTHSRLYGCTIIFFIKCYVDLTKQASVCPINCCRYLQFYFSPTPGLPF